MYIKGTRNSSLVSHNSATIGIFTHVDDPRVNRVTVEHKRRQVNDCPSHEPQIFRRLASRASEPNEREFETYVSVQRPAATSYTPLLASGGIPNVNRWDPLGF